jgi:hypothetical protein
MDILSFISSLASILSLIYYFNDKNPKWWSKYLIPIASGLIGFTLGRISLEISKSISLVFQEPNLFIILVVFFGITILLLFSIQKSEISES